MPNFIKDLQDSQLPAIYMFFLQPSQGSGLEAGIFKH
jgi:hypothetical protein